VIYLISSLATDKTFRSLSPKYLNLAKSSLEKLKSTSGDQTDEDWAQEKMMSIIQLSFYSILKVKIDYV